MSDDLGEITKPYSLSWPVVNPPLSESAKTKIINGLQALADVAVDGAFEIEANDRQYEFIAAEVECYIIKIGETGDKDQYVVAMNQNAADAYIANM